MTLFRFFFLCAGVTVLAACSETVDDRVTVGYVEADWVYVAAPQSGWLATRPVRAGDHVSAGDLLFALDSAKQEAALSETQSRVSQSLAEERNTATGARAAELRVLEARLSEARARLTQAVSERDRILPLVEQGIETRNRGEQVIANAQIAESAVRAATENVAVSRLAARPALREAAKAGVAAAQAQKVSAEVALRDRTIVSSLSGRVAEVFHHPGEFVTAGSPVVALVAEDGLKIKFFVSQEGLPDINLGQRVRAIADGKPDGIDAVVSFIASDAEFTPPVVYSRDTRDKLVFLVEATLPAGSGFKPGLPIDVNWQ